MQLENITVRIPKSLRELIEQAAKITGTTNADEIRKALASYYGVKNAQVTFADLETRILEHEAQMHQLTQNVIDKKQTKEPELAPAEDFEDQAKARKDEANKIRCLEQLSKMLNDGLQPTPSDIGGALGLSPLSVGRTLTSLGIRATNTRINNISARYYLQKLKPLVDDLRQKLNGKSDRS